MVQGFEGGEGALREVGLTSRAVFVQQTGRQGHLLDLLLAVVEQLHHHDGLDQAEHEHRHAHGEEHACSETGGQRSLEVSGGPRVHSVNVYLQPYIGASKLWSTSNMRQKTVCES